MLTTIIISAKQVAMLFVLIILGVILRKVHIFEGKGISSVTDILFYIISPCIIINKLVETASDNPTNAFEIIGWSALTAVIGFAVLFLVVTLVFAGKKSMQIKAVKYATIFANMGFMGIPLAEGIFGEQNPALGTEAAAYVGVSVAIFTMLNFIIGISLFTDKGKSWTSIVLNPGTIAIIIAVIIIVIPVDFTTNSIAAIIWNPIKWLAAAQTPMSMMLCGAILGGVKIKGWYKDKYLWLTTAMRLVILPILTTGVLMLLPYLFDQIKPIVAESMAIAFACPSAVAGAMFAEKFGGDTELLTKSVALTTLLSIISIPLVYAACELIIKYVY